MLTLDAAAKGIDETIAAAEALHRLDGLYEAHDRAIGALKGAAQDYPPEVPSSTYRRTFWLRDGWQDAVSQRGETFEATLRNSVSYAQWVQGDGSQAPVHQGRWEPIGAIGQRLEGRVVAEIESGVDSWLRQAGW